WPLATTRSLGESAGTAIPRHRRVPTEAREIGRPTTRMRESRGRGSFAARASRPSTRTANDRCRGGLGPHAHLTLPPSRARHPYDHVLRKRCLSHLRRVSSVAADRASYFPK